MKKILFTTAYSKTSQNTWKYALRLAQHFEAQITLMHVYEDASVLLLSNHDFMDENAVDHLEDFNKNKQKEEKNRLKKFAADLPKQYQNIPLNYTVASGSVGDAILKEEKENKYDLIVLGTTTTNKFTNTLFGSTSLQILAKANTPIFLVPPMDHYRSIDKIVYATNFESGDVVAIQQLMEWIQAFDAKLHLLHVHKKTLAAQKALDKMKNLVRTFNNTNETGMVTFQVLEGNIVENIEKYLKVTGSDMIALTTHQRGFFAQLFDSSVTNQIATSALVPILVFKKK